MDRISLILLLMTFPGIASGQITGVVETEGGEPIPAASVEAWAAARLLFEAATDAQGRFSFDVPAQEVERLRIAYLGFETVILSGDRLGSGPQKIILHPLPVPLPELEIRATRSVCDEREDSPARSLWAAAAARYSAETGYRGGAARFLFSAGLVDPGSVGQTSAGPQLEEGFESWIGATDTATAGRHLLLERVIEERGYAGPGDRFSARRSLHWAYPQFEGRDAYHFITTTFGARHRFHLGTSGSDGTELVFCPVDRDRPSIQGRIFLAPDTSLLKAQWSFSTRKPNEDAGGEVVFARTPDPSGGYHLVAAQGTFWRREIDGPKYEGVPQPYFQLIRIATGWSVSTDDSMPELPVRRPTGR